MLVQIILIFTPLTEKLYLHLNVAGPPTQADAIVCLGGQPYRVIRTARLYFQRWAPRIIVTSTPGSAEDMVDILLMMGVPRERILVDNASRVTSDHPAQVARLPGVDPRNQRFLLVTDHNHSRRALACFRRAGFQHVSVYAGPPPPSEPEPSKVWRWRIQVLPTVAYEYAALLQYWLQGHI